MTKAADVLCQRWSILVVREALSGSRRFGEIQRGMPGCPPATLSKRLRELVAAGVLQRSQDGPDITYDLTEAGWELYPIVEGFGRWGQRWARSTYADDELDVEVLLWDLRRFLDPAGLGVHRAVVQLDIRVPVHGLRRFWMVVEPEGVDLCMIDPEQPIDAVLSSGLLILTQVWMGDVTMDEALDRSEIVVAGPAALVRRIPAWLGRHPVLADIGPGPRPATPEAPRAP